MFAEMNEPQVIECALYGKLSLWKRLSSLCIHDPGCCSIEQWWRGRQALL